MIKPDFHQLQTALIDLREKKSDEAAFAAAKAVLGLLGITENFESTLFLDPDQKLKKNPSWTETNKVYNKPSAYELLKKNPLPVDGKLYIVDKLTQSRAKHLVALTPNYEDNPGIFLDKNIGIDFIVEKDFAGISIVLTKEYNIRSLTLSGDLTNTQKTILAKWVQAWGVPVEDDKYAAKWKQSLHTVLWESFDISEVNKAFYRGIAERFMLLVQHLKQQGKSEDFAKQFANRLLGRLLFCWFLDKKGFLSAAQSYLTNGTDATEFYRSKLQKLFFLTLNTPQEERGKNPMALVGGLDEETPYLNGGLFEEHAGDTIPPHVKDFFPAHYFTDLFDFWSHYHFTTDENTSDYQAVAIDPEMLGRIFENLLAELNEETGEQARKAKGAFYTPRPIVEYMCQESLWEYLKQHVEERDQEKIYTLLFVLKEHEFDSNKRDDPALKINKGKLLAALDALRVIDPAVGSGAFPMSMLQLMLKLYSRLDARYDRHNTKLQIIADNLFGVDIEPMAVEICRLRAWLSIMVDEKLIPGELNSGIHPLPNLDFKFVCANSLITLPEDKGQATLNFTVEDEVNQLKALRRDFFNATGKKAAIHKKFLEVQGKIAAIQIDGGIFQQTSLSDIEKRAWKMASWNPFANERADFFDPEWMFGIEDGFDIVIGNPPYVQLQKNSGALADLYKDQNFETFARTGDIYCLFYERGLQLSKPSSGLLCFITSNKWMRAGYGDKLRGFFAQHKPLKLLDFGGFKVFEAATVDTNILLIQNAVSSPLTRGAGGVTACHFKNDYKKGADLSEYFQKNSISIVPPGSDTWFIGDDAEITLKKKIETVGTPLKDWNVKINRGVLTGLNEAFIIDQKTRDELIKKDPKSAEILKPILRGRDIKRYSHEPVNNYLIFTGFDLDVPNLYPAVYELLKNIGDAIEGGKIKVKGKGLYKRDDQGKNWWNLRPCDYYDDFEKEKIVWIELVDDGRFAIAEPGVYLNNTMYMMTGQKIKYLCGVLNSQVINWYFDKICGESGVGTNRWIKIYIDQLPPPPIAPQNYSLAGQIEAKVDTIITSKKSNPKADTAKLEREIDILVFKLYGLTEEEVKIVAPGMELTEEEKAILGIE